MKDNGRSIDLSDEEEVMVIPINLEFEAYFKFRAKPCTACGSLKWEGCNINTDGEIVECTECPAPKNYTLN